MYSWQWRNDAFQFMVSRLKYAREFDLDSREPICLDLALFLRLSAELRYRGLSYADIGTSEQELKEFMIKCCKVKARNLIWDIRERGKDFWGYSCQFDSFCEALKMGGLSYIDVGVTKQEFEELQTRRYLHSINELLWRDSKDTFYLNALHSISRDEGLPYASSDTSENKKEIEEVKIKCCKIEAKKWLNYVSQGASAGYGDLYYLRRAMQDGKLSYADIGTSEQEIKELEVKFLKIKAEDLLYKRRNGVIFSLYELLHELQDTGLSYAGIGTSEQELNELHVEDCKKTARCWLDYMRDISRCGHTFFFYRHDLHNVLKSAGLSYADIGTSEQELNELRVKYHKITAQRQLDNLRSASYPYEISHDTIDWSISAAGLSYADIGTSEQELAQLRHKVVGLRRSRNDGYSKFLARRARSR